MRDHHHFLLSLLKLPKETKNVCLKTDLTITHLKVADLLFKTYKQKWSYELSDIKLLTINSDYERQKSLRLDEIQKNLS